MSVTGGQGGGRSAGSVSRRRPREDAARSRAVLVRLTDHVLATGMDFQVIWPRDAQLSRAACDVRDWLIAQRAPVASLGR